MITKWDKRFTAMAELVASFSKDPDFQVGTVLVSQNKKQIAIGYNGFISGIKDDYTIPVIQKLRQTIHAEINAVLNARTDIAGWTTYSTRFPCDHCACVLAQSKIFRIVCPPPDGHPSRWSDSQATAKRIFLEANVWIKELQ